MFGKREKLTVCCIKKQNSNVPLLHYFHYYHYYYYQVIITENFHTLVQLLSASSNATLIMEVSQWAKLFS